jgi:hypothetical protein
MNNIPAWCRIAKVNYRVEVSQPGLSLEKDLDNLADELNELFESHKNWSDTRAEATYDEAVLCQFCGNVYVPYYEEDRKDTVCDMCGKGKYEWAIEILEKSKGVTTNEDILS